MADHLSGRIESFDLADIFQMLEVNRASGRLILARGSERKTIDWKDGDIIYVSGSRPADRLGNVLLKTGVVSAPDLYRVFARHFSTRERLSYVLIESGVSTREQLAAAVEGVATRILREVLSWRAGRFDFDAGYRTEDLLQIHLNIKSQVVLFQAAKDRDEFVRRRHLPQTEPAVDPGDPNFPFRPEKVDEDFWTARMRSGAESMEPEAGYRRFLLFREMASAVRERISRLLSFLPVYEDTARFVTDLLSIGPIDEEVGTRLVGVVKLDPFFAMNLLQLANALLLRNADAVSLPEEAVRRIGPEAFAALASHLSDASHPRLSVSQPIPLALRRAALAAAFTAQSIAESLSLDPDEAYTAGLLHVVPYMDLLEAVSELEFPSGPFRAASIEIFRPIVGRIRSEALGLPPSLSEVLADEGEPDAPALLLAVRAARTAFPACTLGTTTAAGGKWPPDEATRGALVRVFDFLDLGKP